MSKGFRGKMIKISYDKEGDVSEVKFSENTIENSDYVEESGLILDYDKNGNIIAIEIVSFSKRVGKYELVKAIAT